MIVGISELILVHQKSVFPISTANPVSTQLTCVVSYPPYVCMTVKMCHLRRTHWTSLSQSVITALQTFGPKMKISFLMFQRLGERPWIQDIQDIEVCQFWHKSNLFSIQKQLFHWLPFKQNSLVTLLWSLHILFFWAKSERFELSIFDIPGMIWYLNKVP